MRCSSGSFCCLTCLPRSISSICELIINLDSALIHLVSGMYIVHVLGLYFAYQVLHQGLIWQIFLRVFPEKLLVLLNNFPIQHNNNQYVAKYNCLQIISSPSLVEMILFAEEDKGFL